MWVTADHRLHTVAVPHPEELFTEPALETLVALLADLGMDAIDEIVETAETNIFELFLDTKVDLDAEAPFAEAAAPIEIFSALVYTRDQLAAAIDDIDLRWRLDVLMALQDLADTDR